MSALFTKPANHRFAQPPGGQNPRGGFRLSLKGKVLFGAQIICTGEEDFFVNLQRGSLQNCD